MTNKEYHEHSAISASQLKWLAEDAGEFMHKFFAPKLEPTPAMQKGTEFHDYLERMLKGDAVPKETFEQAENAAFGENPNRRLKEYQTWKKDNAHLPSGDALAMAKTVFNIPQIKRLSKLELKIENSFFEQFVLSENAEKYKAEFRCRPDVFAPETKMLIDWKSMAAIPTERTMQKEINKRFNWVQVGLYTKILRSKGFNIDKFVFVFVKNTVPYQTGILYFTNPDIDNSIKYVDYLMLRAVKLLQGVEKITIPACFAPEIYAPQGYEI